MVIRPSNKTVGQEPLALVVLAAGLGKRMQSDMPKALARTSEVTLIEHVLKSALSLKPERCVVVVGHKGELVEKQVREALGKKYLSYDGKIHFANQKEQLGTGDAVKSALNSLEDFTGNVLILCADMPLIKESTLQSLGKLHGDEQATLSLISLKTSNPAAYGRILRDAQNGQVQAIVEARDCSAQQLLIDEINAAIYMVDSAFLAPAVREIKNENAQREYYLTDIVARAAQEGQRIASLVLRDEKEIQGVNTKYELALVNRSLLDKRIKELIEAGVEMTDPLSVYLDPTVKIAPGVKIGPNVQILGNSTVEAGASIEGCAYILDSHLKRGAHVKLGVRMESALVGSNASVGPFAHLRPGTELGEEVKIGNFVETKKAKLAKGAKASHLTYLGDCSVGTNANIGAGTITCNYDGYNKSETLIGKNVFIGSNSSLVAPVKIADGATVGAGSVITKDVEADSLAVTRAPQVSKPGWSKAKREKFSK